MQRLKAAIKKVAAVGAGVALLGATLTSAVALDLSEYPAPFVMDGEYSTDNALVVGRNALASDTLGVANIARQLQFESKICTPGSTVAGAVTVSGDSVEVSRSGDLLELREPVSSVRQTLTEVELDGLASGVVSTNEGTTKFNQYLRFSKASSTGAELIASPVVNFTENDAPSSEVSDFLVILEGTRANQSFFEYELQFEDGLESDIKGTSLDDLEDEEIIMLGGKYIFVDTKIDTSAEDVTLDLLGGAEYAILEEGEVRTFTVDGKEYEVEALLIEDTSPATVTLKVNGEVTSQLVNGETELLSDGTLLGVSKIILNEAGEAGLGDIVEVFVGATKVRFKDTNFVNEETTSGVTNLGFENFVEINEERIEDAWVQIRATQADTNTTFEINTIKYRLVADPLPGQKDLYVPPGHGIREYIDEPQGLLGDWDIRYEGLDDIGVTTIKMNPRSDDEYQLEFENLRGDVYKFPLLSNKGGNFKYGDDDNDFVFREGNITVVGSALVNNTYFNIGRLDYFPLSDIGTSNRVDDTATTHIIRYDGIDTANKQLQFEDLATGTQNFIYTESTSTVGELGRANLLFGGNTYSARIANLSSSNDDNPLAIDMDADGDVDSSEIKLTVNGGGVLDLGEHNNVTNTGYSIDGAGVIGLNNSTGTLNTTQVSFTRSPVFITLTTVSQDFDENRPSSLSSGTLNEITNFTVVATADNRIGVNLSITGTNAAAGANFQSTGGLQLHQPDEDDDYYYAMTDYGALLTIYDPSSTNDPETVTIEYPLQQRGANVFVVMGQTTTTKSSAGEVCTPQDIDVMTYFDDEVTDASANNLIFVGGPCINSAIDKVEGLPTCDEFREQYGPGDGVVQLVQNGDHVAMLVAGYNAEDTLLAAKAVEKKIGLTGTTVIV